MAQDFYLLKGEDRARIRANLDRYLDRLPPNRVFKVTVKQHVKKRSTAANARWWALLTAISQQAPAHMDGQWFHPEVWHKSLVVRFAGMEPGPFGNGIPKQTSKMDREEFEALMYEAEAWAFDEFPGFRFDPPAMDEREAA